MTQTSRWPRNSPSSRGDFAPARIASIYAVIGALWIVSSDAILAWVLPNAELNALFQTAKGWGFILCTAGLLYFLVRRLVRGLRKEGDARIAAEAELNEKNREFATLISNLPGMVYRCRNDRAWTMEVISGGCRELCGYDANELTESPEFSYGCNIIHGEDQDNVWRSVQDALKDRRPFQIAYRINCRSGALKWVWERGRGVFDDDGTLQAIEGFITDITELREAKQVVSKLTQAVEQNASAILIADASGVVEYANTRYALLTGYSVHEAIGKRLDALKWRKWKRNELERLLARASADGPLRRELSVTAADGRSLCAEATISRIIADDGMSTHILLMMEDITARKDYEKQLLRHANYDDATGLPNRILANDRLEQAIRHALASQSRLSVVVINIGGLGRIEQSLGLSARDEVIREIAGRVQSAVDDETTLARISSEKLLIILPELSSVDHLERRAEQILDIVKKPCVILDVHVSAAASIGVCVAPDDGETGQEILLNAMAASTRARDAGGDRVRFFSPSLDAKARMRVSIENRIRRGLADGRFRVEFQPIVDLRNGGVAAAEALVRLDEVEGQSLTPDAFIPIAEESGLIIDIGAVVLRDACIMARLALEQGCQADFAIAVNLSARELESNQYVDLVAETLRETGLEPKHLELEITERAFVQDTEESRANLRQLRDLGVRLTIDDFGTGQASIEYLQRMSFDKLKIDKSYIRDIKHEGGERALAGAILSLAQALGIRVVGEGVETETQAIWLRHMGCDYGQGFLFSAALPKQEFVAIVRKSFLRDAPSLATTSIVNAKTGRFSYPNAKGGSRKSS